LLAREGRGVVVMRGSTYEIGQIWRPVSSTRSSANTKARVSVGKSSRHNFWTTSRARYGTVNVSTETRWPARRNVPDLKRIVVAVDPAASSGEEADETGIIVAGQDAAGHGYVLEDQSGRYLPTEWARIVISLYRQGGPHCRQGEQRR